MVMETVLKTGLWLACGMIAWIGFVLMEKKENGEVTITMIDLIVIAMGPTSLGFLILNLLTKISIKV